MHNFGRYVLIATAYFLAGTTNTFMAVAQSELDTVKAAVKDERCSAPLRATFFHDVFVRSSASQRSNFSKYLWCSIDVGSENEAQSKKIDINAVYEALSINANSRDAFSRAKDWKRSNCGANQVQEYSQQANIEITNSVNAPVAIRALDVYRSCVTNQTFGLHCDAVKHTDSSVSFFINYIPDRAGVPAPAIVSSRVRNAQRNSARAGDYTVFKRGAIIPPAGLTATFTRKAADKDVIFDVSLSRGFGSCPANNLVVPALPSYTITARLQVEGKIEKTKDFFGKKRVDHLRCNYTEVGAPIRICPEDGFLLQSGSYYFDAEQNPGKIAGDTRFCFGAKGSTPPVASGGGCFDATILVQECTQGDDFGGCMAAWRDGGNFGTRVFGRMTGTRLEAVKSPSADRTWVEVGPGLYSIATTPLPNGARDIVASWSVTLIDSRTKESYTINNDTPPNDPTYKVFEPHFDSRDGTLRTLVPK